MSVCPFCFSKKMRKFGFYHYRGQAKQKYMCGSCGGVTAFALRRIPTKRRKRS